MNDGDPVTGAHPDADALSELDAGLLDDTAEAAQLQDHVAGCRRCADLLLLLRDTHRLLAGLPAVAIPAEVAARIDAALAAETTSAPRTAEAPVASTITAPATSPGSVTVLSTARRGGRSAARRRWLPGAGAVAAGVAVLLAGAVGLGALQQRGGHSAATSRAAGAGAPHRTAAVPAAPVVTGRDYTPATLDDGVRSLLAAGSTPKRTPAPLFEHSPGQSDRGSAVQPVDPALNRLRQPAALGACVAELAGNPRIAALAVELARFQGRPAAVVVLPDPDPAKVRAWVVGPACGPGQADVLRFQIVPRAG